MKVAIIHDWLVSQRGGENVLDAICELFPQAELFTLVHKKGSVSKNIEKLKIHTSFLQKIPSAELRYRHMLPLMPFAIEQFDMSAFDLILSSSHCVAKGVKKSESAFHVSYIHAPMRYMWDRFEEYFERGRYSLPVTAAAHIFRPYLQSWDKKSATRVDHFIANSNFIKEKINKYYNRNADVVYPFCEPDRFQLKRNPNDEYLIVTALVPYKRVDLAIEAFNQMQKKLTIIGDGPDLDRLKNIAGPTIQFKPPVQNEELATAYSHCKALIFPGIEDFGIVPCEAMAAGSPVIALGVGGALETVTSETGVFFKEKTVAGLCSAVERFEKSIFSESKCRERGRFFNRKKFQKEYLEVLQKVVPTKIGSFSKILDSVS